MFRSLICTRYGIRIRVAGMKILSPRPLDEPSILFSGDVRSRTGVCTNVHTTFLSDCIGFEVLGTSTNNHNGGRLHIRRPIDTGQNSWLTKDLFQGL